MGKHGKKHQRNKCSRRERGAAFYLNDEEADVDNGHHPPASSVSKLSLSDTEEEEEEDEDDGASEGEDNDYKESSQLGILPSKFSLYQQSVQSPKGEISYLQKFFLEYVGGRIPLHLQEDFCGTALLSVEWLRSDSRRTAVGLDLDLEALSWCLENNIDKISSDWRSRISLFHGNVLHPSEANLVKFENKEKVPKATNINKEEEDPESMAMESTNGSHLMKGSTLPARDIICAFNYSCCCLHSRDELVSYFKHARNNLSRKGGIFVMDLYGGKSSEGDLKLQRKFPNFTYVWEQAGFDIIHRKTRINLHYHLQKPQRKLRYAFSYSWRLWSLPEIKDCLQEAGFQSIHFWIRRMPNSEEIKTIKGFGSNRDVKYEEVKSFEQQDSWNAYIVAVA